MLYNIFCNGRVLMVFFLTLLFSRMSERFNYFIFFYLKSPYHGGLLTEYPLFFILPSLSASVLQEPMLSQVSVSLHMSCNSNDE